MILKIKHQTNYYYSSCVPRLVQSLKLFPSKSKNQKIIDWKITCNRGSLEESHQDALGHKIFNIFNDNFFGKQTILSQGTVETKDYNGVMNGLQDKVNPLCFLRHTNLTTPGKELTDFSKKIRKSNDVIKFCHSLNLAVSNSIRFKSGATTNETTAESSFKQGEGVCQDYAHILISLARLFEIPARYVNGYLLEDNNTNKYFTHAWVELYISDLGWVAFDPSHKRCIDESYVRLSCGYDFIDASPIKGVKLNYLGEENLSFRLDIHTEQ